MWITVTLLYFIIIDEERSDTHEICINYRRDKRDRLWTCKEFCEGFAYRRLMKNKEIIVPRFRNRIMRWFPVKLKMMVVAKMKHWKFDMKYEESAAIFMCNRFVFEMLILQAKLYIKTQRIKFYPLRLLF